MEFPTSVFTYFVDCSVNDGPALLVERYGGMLQLAQAVALELRIWFQ